MLFQAFDLESLFCFKYSENQTRTLFMDEKKE